MRYVFREFKLDHFDEMFSVLLEDIEFELRGQSSVPWAEFILNPRRLRGSDFLMRWSQGVWSEQRLIHAVNDTQDYIAIPYGPSSTAPSDDVRAFELYFERLEHAGVGSIKRPDLLIFKKKHESDLNNFVNKIGGVSEIPFLKESELAFMLERSILAIECENSLWKSKKMPNYGCSLEAQKRMGGKLGLKKNAVVPTIILKEEDREPLRKWQLANNRELHIWHVFYDQAFGIDFNQAEKLINDGYIEPTAQTFQAPGGPTTKKIIYKIYYHHAYLLGDSKEEPVLSPQFIEDKNGHILPFVRFEGGKLKISKDALNFLYKLSNT